MSGFNVFTTKKEKIKTLKDPRLIKIDPQEDGFFNSVINFKSSNDSINMFIDYISEIKKANIEAFYRPIYDPSEVGDFMVTYQKGNKPAVNHSYNWWVKTAAKMPAVEGKQWHVANEYQYYCFIVWLINQLVKAGNSVETALNMMIVDSKNLGHYYKSKGSAQITNMSLEPTGSRCVCGVYDLANTNKILSYSNIGEVWFDCNEKLIKKYSKNKKVGDFWIGGGDCCSDQPITYIVPFKANEDHNFFLSVGMLVL